METLKWNWAYKNCLSIKCKRRNENSHKSTNAKHKKSHSPGAILSHDIAHEEKFQVLNANDQEMFEADP
jgi:hypothetical protein